MFRRFPKRLTLVLLGAAALFATAAQAQLTVTTGYAGTILDPAITTPHTPEEYKQCGKDAAQMAINGLKGKPLKFAIVLVAPYAKKPDSEAALKGVFSFIDSSKVYGGLVTVAMAHNRPADQSLVVVHAWSGNFDFHTTTASTAGETQYIGKLAGKTIGAAFKQIPIPKSHNSLFVVLGAGANEISGNVSFTAGFKEGYCSSPVLYDSVPLMGHDAVQVFKEGVIVDKNSNPQKVTLGIMLTGPFETEFTMHQGLASTRNTPGAVANNVARINRGGVKDTMSLLLAFCGSFQIQAKDDYVIDGKPSRLSEVIGANVPVWGIYGAGAIGRPSNVTGAKAIDHHNPAFCAIYYKDIATNLKHKKNSGKASKSAPDKNAMLRGKRTGGDGVLINGTKNRQMKSSNMIVTPKS